MWLYILLSFAFYIPVAIGAGSVPMLGMLMLPKTVCYILMVAAFLKKQNFDQIGAFEDDDYKSER